MSTVKNETETTLSSRFKVSFEIILIYATAGLIILTFFDPIKVALYASLGYVALFMFLSVFILMVGYTLYNFGKALYIFLIR
jgi:hypothetical protein